MQILCKYIFILMDKAAGNTYVRLFHKVQGNAYKVQNMTSKIIHSL